MTGIVGGFGDDAMGPAEAAPSGAQAAEARLFQYDPGRTGTTTSTGPRTTPVKLWQTSTQYAYASAPAVAGGTVYASGTNGLAAFRASDGTQSWNFTPAATDTDPSSFGTLSSSPAVTNDTVYVGSSDGNLYAVDANNGDERWRFATGGSVYSSPVVVNDRIYVGSTDGRVYALDSNGDEVWRASTGRPVLSSPAVANGTVYVGNGEGGGNDVTAEGGVVALDATNNGAQLWSFQPAVPAFEGDGPFYSTPAVDDGTVYIGNRGRRTAVYALDADTGKKQWQFGQNPGISIDCSPAVANGTVFVYAGGKFGTFYALDAASGRPQWQFSTSEFLFASSSPTVADGTVVVASSTGDLYALDSVSGVPQWQYSLADGTKGSPAVAGRRVYIGDDRGLKSLGEESIDVGITATDSKVAPGDEVTVNLRVTNETVESVAPELTVSVPSVFEIAGHTDDGGNYDASGGPSWTWSGVGPGSIREPTLTLEAKGSAGQGDYSLDAAVSATLNDGDTLSATTSETLTITKAPFNAVKGEKLTLAARIDNVAETFEETPAVESALDYLTKLVNDGTISQDRGIEAVERLKLTEDVAETALVTAGPADTVTPEDGSTLVGSPNDENFDLFEKIAKFVIDVKATLYSLAANLARLSRSLVATDDFAGLDLAQDFLDIKSLIQTIIKLVVGLVEPVLKSFGMKDTVEVLLVAKAEAEPAKVLAKLSQDKQRVKEDIARRFERGSPDFHGIKDGLDSSRSQLSGQATTSGEPSFSGSLGDAETTASTAETGIRNEIVTASNQFETVDLFTKVFAVFSALATLWLSLLGPSGFVVGAVIGAMGLIGPFAKAFTALRSGFITLTRVQVNHDQALADIVDPQ